MDIPQLDSNMVFYAFSSSDSHHEFNISYTVKDKKATKNELLGKVVYDAKEEAVVLKQASDVTLKDIQTIDYF